MRARVQVLLVVLAGVLVWSGFTLMRRASRVKWARPLQVSVVLVSTAEISQDVGFAWRDSLPRLETWLTTQLRRYRTYEVEHAVRFTVGVPVKVAALPEFEPPSDELAARAEHALTLNRSLKELEEAALLPSAPYDVRLFVVLTPEQPEELARVEGIAARGGEIGMVRAPLSSKEIDLEMAALAHELFHCLGAVDAYGADGHATVPNGLVEPGKDPLYPQALAEVMVGEIPLGPAQGRVPKTLDEVAVGPHTAAQLNWIE